MTNSPTESLVARLRAFDEERFYQEPATAYATMQEAAERLSTLEAALAGIQARIKPQIIAALREWAEFEQDGGNVEQGAAIDAILDWYDAATKTV